LNQLITYISAVVEAVGGLLTQFVGLRL
jgi:hypothetical protein